MPQSPPLWNHAIRLLTAFALLVCVSALLAKADSLPGTTNVNVDVIMGTLTVQTAGGDVLDTFNDLYINETIPADLATQIGADPIVPTYIQNNIGRFAVEDDYSFLDGSSFPQELLGVSGALSSLGLAVPADEFLIVPTDLASISLGPITSNTGVVAVANDQYEVIGANSMADPSEIYGFINVNYYADSVVETVAAAPEPNPLTLLGAALVTLIVCAQRAVVGGDTR